MLLSTFFIALYSQSAFASNLTGDKDRKCPVLTDFTDEDIRKGQVKWIPDGDTIHTVEGEKLRLSHINAPELNINRDKPAEFLADESRLALIKNTGINTTIYWVYDSERKDRYERSLVLLFNHKKQFMNYEMVKSGLALSLIVPPNHRFWKCIRHAERTAFESLKGVWNRPSAHEEEVSSLNGQSGFKLVEGVISNIKESKSNLWIILNNHLWVKINHKDLNYFAGKQLNFEVGQKVRVRGYVFKSYGKIKMNLRHPSMITRSQ